MKQLTAILSIAIALQAISAKAAVDPAVHQACLSATDYAGCVKVQTGGVGTTETATEKFNSCPGDFRYAGGGNCVSWDCFAGFGAGGHNQELAGKDSGCRGGGVMRWTNDTAKAFFDPSCPDTTFEIGWRSTCSMAQGAR
jgi:hypothetical protein